MVQKRLMIVGARPLERSVKTEERSMLIGGMARIKSPSAPDSQQIQMQCKCVPRSFGAKKELGLYRTKKRMKKR
jgi:hypothetical protein